MSIIEKMFRKRLFSFRTGRAEEDDLFWRKMTGWSLLLLSSIKSLDWMVVDVELLKSIVTEWCTGGQRNRARMKGINLTEDLSISLIATTFAR